MAGTAVGGATTHAKNEAVHLGAHVVHAPARLLDERRAEDVAHAW